MKHNIDYKLSKEEFKKELEQMALNGATIEELFDEAFAYVWVHDLLVGEYNPYNIWIGGQTYHFDLNKPNPTTEELLKEIHNEVQNGIWESSR